jgi:hypothetical protein
MWLPPKLLFSAIKTLLSVILAVLVFSALMPMQLASADQAPAPVPPALAAKPKLEAITAEPSEFKLTRGQQTVRGLTVRNVSGGDLAANGVEFKFKSDAAGISPDIAKPQATGLEGVTLKDKDETAIYLWFPAYDKDGEYSGELYLKLPGTDTEERFHSFKMIVQEPSPPAVSKNWSALWAAAFGVFVLVVARLVRRRTKHGFLQSPDGFYSVSRFQVFVWTVVIVISYVYLYFRTGPGVVFPDNIWYLMGISVGSLSIATGIAINKQQNIGGGTAPASTPAGGAGAAGAQPRIGWLASMLSDDGSPSLARWQMFIWTIATAAFFLRQTFATNTLWEVPAGLLVLMGISHGGYLVDKGVAPKKEMKVQSLQPAQGASDKDVPLVIAGLNFKPDTVSCFVGGKQLQLTAKSSGKLEATLPANSLSVGKYDLLVQQPGEDAEIVQGAFEVK